MKFLPCFLVFSCIYLSVVYSQTQTVITNADDDIGSLRAAIEEINDGSDDENTIFLKIPGNSPILLSSDLPVIKKNTVINSTGKQTIDGQGQYRLFATIMADLTINNCTLQNGAAIGGSAKLVKQEEVKVGFGGGLGAGGAVYIDRGHTLRLDDISLQHCQARGSNLEVIYSPHEGSIGGGASFSEKDKNEGGDYRGIDTPGESDGSPYLTGYGGGEGGFLSNQGRGGKGGGNGPGKDGSITNKIGGDGGYCGGGGLYTETYRAATGGGRQLVQKFSEEEEVLAVDRKVVEEVSVEEAESLVAAALEGAADPRMYLKILLQF